MYATRVYRPVVVRGARSLACCSTLRPLIACSLEKKLSDHTHTLARRKVHGKTFSSQPSLKAQAQAAAESEPWEEETLPDFHPDDFYPVNIGDVLNDRYKVVGKLGFGRTSTTWLAEDQEKGDFVCLKIYGRAMHKVNWEVMIYGHFSASDDGSSHPGKEFIRAKLDKFELTQDNGNRHSVLVHPPLLTTLYDYIHLQSEANNTSQPLSLNTIRAITRGLLQALDYLHNTCNITHSDIKASNLLLPVPSSDIFHEYTNTSEVSPAETKKLTSTYTIHRAQPLSLSHLSSANPSHPILVDFGESRIGSHHGYQEVFPAHLRPPEILLELPQWDHQADIWAVGSLLWSLVEGQPLFSGINSETGEYDERVHLAEVVEAIGLPPVVMLRKSPVGHMVFNEDGSWKGPPKDGVLPAGLGRGGLEERVSDGVLGTGREKRQFVDFVEMMLRWDAAERVGAKELSSNPWLNEE